MTNLDNYTHRVSIDNHVEWQHHQQIARWCMQQFGEHNHCVTWRHALPGSPYRSHPEFSTWLFVHESDAQLFQLTWTFHT